jgi:predicted GIY-YIG superfamily endonuclease
MSVVPESIESFSSGIIAYAEQQISKGFEPWWMIDMIDEWMGAFYDQGVNKDVVCKHRDNLYVAFEDLLLSHGLSLEINKMVNNRPKQESTGYVYLIKNEKGLVKIGRSINPQARITCISTQSGETYTEVYISKKIKYYNKAEVALHKKFAPKRVVGEWFDIDMAEAIEFIESTFKAVGKSPIPKVEAITEK